MSEIETDVGRGLGRVEGKLDLVIDTLNDHQKSLDGLQRKVYYWWGIFAAGTLLFKAEHIHKLVEAALAASH